MFHMVPFCTPQERNRSQEVIPSDSGSTILDITVHPSVFHYPCHIFRLSRPCRTGVICQEEFPTTTTLYVTISMG